MAFYQASIAGSQATIAAFVAWAGNSGGNNGISYALTQLGFAKMADTYTANWAGAIAEGADALPGVGNFAAAGLNGTAFPTVTNTARTALASTNFMGTWAQGVYAPGNVVVSTSGSPPGQNLAYICVSATTNTPGETPANTTYWSPYYMEIWEFTGGPGGLTPFYMKLEYGCSATAATDPMLTIQFGTGYSVGASGYLTGNVTQTELCFNGSGTIAATECDFAGDGSNYLAIQMFRGGAANPGPSVIVAERAISGIQSNAPVYNSAYMTYIKGYSAAGNWYQQSLFLSGTPTTAVRVNYGNTMTLGAATATLIVNNTTPALPVFPLVGYCGNPLTVITAQQEADTTEGAIQSCTVYGASHNFIATKTTMALAFGGSGQTSSYGVLVRAD